MTTTSIPHPTTNAETGTCCTEFARMSRRSLIGGTIGAAGLATTVGSAVVSAAPAMAATADAVLVVLSMRGAHDGMSMVVPYADPTYYVARPRTAIPLDRLIAADGMFGLHPSLSPLMPLWNAGEFAAVHAAGLPAPNRSHFAAMEEIEDADPGSSERIGWLNRLLGELPGAQTLQGFSVSREAIPTSLYGPQRVMSAEDVDDVELPGSDQYDPNNGRRRSLDELWNGNTSPLGNAMSATFEAIDNFEPVLSTTDNTSSYPSGDLGRALASAARIIRGNVGTEVITVDQGDWDHHTQLGTPDWGRMKSNATEFAQAIAAFFNDLGTQRSKVTLVAFSEFGRRVKENNNFGLDHGYGNAMYVAGAGVKGGFHGTWPGLAGSLDDDLLVTTDFRSVLSEVVSRRFNASTAAVFPGFSPESVGVMR